MLDPRLTLNNEDVTVLVDINIIMDKHGHLNHAFLKALKATKLTHLFIMCNTIFTKENIITLMNLWIKLVDMDFYVYGYITPQDLCWTEMFHAKKPKLPRQINYNIQEIGGAFRETITHIETSKSRDISTSYLVGSEFIRQNFKDIIPPKTHIKSVMLEFFLYSLPFDTKRVIIFDSDPKAIKALSNFIPSPKKDYVPPYAVIPVLEKSKSTEAYEDEILMHPIIAINIIKEAISHHLFKLSESTNLFLSSSENKQKVLHEISFALQINQTRTSRTVGEIINTCLNKSVLRPTSPALRTIPSYAQVTKSRSTKTKKTVKPPSNLDIISRPRNIFSSTRHPKETNTLSLINVIKSTFGNVVVPPRSKGRIVSGPQFLSMIKPSVLSPTSQNKSHKAQRPKPLKRSMSFSL